MSHCEIVLIEAKQELETYLSQSVKLMIQSLQVCTLAFAFHTAAGSTRLYASARVLAGVGKRNKEVNSLIEAIKRSAYGALGSYSCMIRF
jgi:hypothetical protein